MLTCGFSSHNQVVQSNGPKNLNYWSLPQQDQNGSPVRQKGGMSYNGSTAQMTYSKPEDYHLPNNYKIGQKPQNPNQNQGQYGQYQNLQHQEYTLQQYTGNQGKYFSKKSFNSFQRKKFWQYQCYKKSHVLRLRLQQ